MRIYGDVQVLCNFGNCFYCFRGSLTFVSLLFLIPNISDTEKDNFRKDYLYWRFPFGSLWFYRVQKHYYFIRNEVINNEITLPWCILSKK